MTETEQRIQELRQQGMDQYQIATHLGLPVEEVERAIFGRVDADMIEYLHWSQHY